MSSQLNEPMWAVIMPGSVVVSGLPYEACKAVADSLDDKGVCITTVETADRMTARGGHDN